MKTHLVLSAAAAGLALGLAASAQAASVRPSTVGEAESTAAAVTVVTSNPAAEAEQLETGWFRDWWFHP